MELSSDVLRPFLVWGLRSDDETVIGNRRLHLLESSGASFEACLSFCTLEEMKRYFKTLKPWLNGVASRRKLRPLRAEAWHTRSDDASDLSIIFWPVSAFWQNSHLETLIRFCMEMFKYSEFDLERTTTNSTIIVYISLDFLLWQTLPFAAIEQNTASESFVLIAGCFLLQFTKLVIGLSKSVSS